MPRAVDPFLIGQQLPITHSPLNRIGYQNRKPPLEIQDLMEGARRFVEDYLFPVIEELTGIDLSVLLPLLDLLDLDFSSPTAFLSSLIDAIVALPAVLINLLTGLINQLTGPDGQANLTILISGLIELLVNLPALLTQLANGLIAAGTNLLGIGSPLNALNLFNIVPPTLLGMLDVSHIGKSVTNLLTDPNFLDPSAFSGGGIWTHSLTGGFGGLGAVFTTANGTVKELLGNLIPVSEGQILPISGKAKWTGLVGTGNPIALAITGYLGGNPTVQATVASHNTTPPTTDWLILSGSYVVPANVDSLRTRLFVGSTATAGTVGFSNMSVTKTGAMLQNLIRGTNPGEFLPDDVSHLFNGIISNTTELLNKAGLADFNNLLSAIGGQFGTDLAAAQQRLDDFLHSLSPLNADHINSGAVLDDFVPGLADIHDNIVAAVGNLSGGGFDLAKMFEVLTGQTHSVVDAAAGVTNMFGRLSILESKVAALPVTAGGTGSGNADGGVVGANDYDSFERVNSTSLGPDWLTFYNGAGKWATANGHDAQFIASGTGNTEFVAIRNNIAIPRSQTNYQRVTLELSSKATRMYDALFGTYNYCGFDDLWLRVSDATTSLANITGIRIRYGGDGGLTIHQFVNGTPTLLNGLGTGGITPPGPGANLIGEAGVLADGAPLAIRAKIGASIRLQANSTLTPGATLRRWGHGGRAEGHLIPIPARQEIPGGAHYWNGMDQTLS